MSKPRYLHSLREGRRQVGQGAVLLQGLLSVPSAKAAPAQGGLVLKDGGDQSPSAWLIWQLEIPSPLALGQTQTQLCLGTPPRPSSLPT